MRARRRTRTKLVLVLVDGLGDVGLQGAPACQLGRPGIHGRTPLQVASTPWLDALARAGLNGLMDPVQPGLACGSDTAHLALFGYPPQHFYRGRGSFEAMGAGLAMQPGDVAFKSNFATLDTQAQTVLRRRADRQFEDIGPVLCSALSGCALPSFPDVEVQVRYATEHRCGVLLRGPGLSDLISGTDPLVDQRPLLRSAPLPLAGVTSPALARAQQRSADVVNEVSRCFQRMLEAHPVNARRKQQGKPPANAVLLRGPGERIKVPSFYELHGLRAFMVAPTAIIAGLGMSLGMHRICPTGATGDYGTDMLAKAKATSAALLARGLAQTCAAAGVLADGSSQRVKAQQQQDGEPAVAEEEMDFAFLHVKVVDDAGHDKDCRQKVACLERVDQMLGALVCALQEGSRADLARQRRRNQDGGSGQAKGSAASGAEEEEELCWLLAVTGDHSTPLHLGDHSCEPVPFTVCALSNLRETPEPSAAPQHQPRPKKRRTEDVAPSSTSSSQSHLSTFSLLSSSSPSSSSSSSSSSSPFSAACLTDAVQRFDEVSAAEGFLGRFPGHQLMPLLKSLRDLLDRPLPSPQLGSDTADRVIR